MTCRPRVCALLGLTLLAAGCTGQVADPAAQAAAAPTDTEAARLLSSADAAIAGDRLAEAGRLLDEARARAPEDPDVWVAIARLRFRGGEHLAALDAADRALALGPDHAPALVMRALMVRDAHGNAAALPWFEAALAADPRHADALAEYAATLGDLGRGGAMLDAVRALAEAAPEDPRIFYLQAVLAARGGRPVLARSLLDRSGLAAREVPAALLLDALIHLETGNHASAAAGLDELVDRQPANARLRELLARALLLSGRDRAVIERFAAEAAEPEASAYLAMLVGRAHERLGERDKAAPLLARAHAPASGAPVALAVRAGLPAPTARLRTLAAAGNWAEARSAAAGFAARYPVSADFAQLAGDAALGAGDARAALAAYAPAASVRRAWPLTLKAVHAYRLAGDDAAADTLLARHVSGEPDNIAALLALATAVSGEGEWQRAALLLDHAIALGGGHDPGLLELRAAAARALGDRAGAEHHAMLLAELRPPALAAR